MNKKVLISGITGQDGSYMAEYCLALGNKVFGMVRRSSSLNDRNFKHLYSNPDFKMVYGDLSDSHSLNNLVKEINPDYFINLAAQSFVGVSWSIPKETFMVNAVGVLNCLESIRNYAPNCRFYNAGTSEQFGDVVYSPQDEKHPFRPRSPYGASKCAASNLVKVYRDSYNLYAVQGILFNHESERRGEEFVTRKITKGVARIVKAIKNNESFKPIELGNVQAKRDWSHALDFVDGIWKMLNQEEYNKDLFFYHAPEYVLKYEDNKKMYEYIISNLKEYVLSSGETHTIREFIEKSFDFSGISKICEKEHGSGFFHWYGDSIKYGSPEKDPNAAYYWSKSTDMGEVMTYRLMEINPQFYRPAEVELLLGDSTLARKELGWEPKISFDKLVKCMVESDLNELGTSKNK